MLLGMFDRLTKPSAGKVYVESAYVWSRYPNGVSDGTRGQVEKVLEIRAVLAPEAGI